MATEETTIVPCTVCPMYDKHPVYDVHPQASALLESVQFMLRHGKTPSQVIKQLLDMYGEDLPRPIAVIEDLATYSPAEAAAMREALLLVKRQRGWAQLGLA